MTEPLSMMWRWDNQSDRASVNDVAMGTIKVTEPDVAMGTV